MATLMGFFVLTAASAAPGATIYVYQSLDAPGASSTSASGVNDAGQVVGSYTDASGTHGFVTDGTNWTTLNYPGTTGTTNAEGINDAGQIVGSYQGPFWHGFVKDSAGYTSFDVPPLEQFPHTFTSGNGINDAGVIVGGTDFMTDTLQSYVKDGAAWGTFGTGLLTTSVAHDINVAGQVVGVINEPGIQAGYLLSGGSFTTLLFPGSAGTAALGINDALQIVGSFFETPGSLIARGFLKEGEVFSPIDFPDAVATVATDINNEGLIVGRYEDEGGVTHAFIATPVPEPSSLALVGSGFVALLAWRRATG